MVKTLLAIIPAMILFIVSFFKEPEDKLKVTANYPAVIRPGDEFIVTLNVHKPKITGTARLQQYLPQGFSAFEIQSSGADFIFEEQNVKFLWSTLPSEDDFTISYKVKTESNVNGFKVINGLFVYMDDDKTIREAIPPIEIKADNEFVGTGTGKGPEVARKLISISPENGEYRVELTIRTNNVTEWARFTDAIPEDYTAKVIDAHQAQFTFENNNAIFNWKNLPAEEEFVVSYLVRSGKPGTPPVINGLLTFGNQNQSSNNIAEEEKPINEINVNNYPENSPNGMTNEQEQEKVNKTGMNSESENTQTENAEPVNRDPVSTADNSQKLNPPRGNTAKYRSPSLDGILFKVQISATKKSSTKSSNWFNSKYHINTDVELTYHEGWKKYLIGNCIAFQEAKVLRSKTIEKIPDAFVVAYDNGTRIDVKEAINKKSLNQ